MNAQDIATIEGQSLQDYLIALGVHPAVAHHKVHAFSLAMVAGTIEREAEAEITISCNICPEEDRATLTAAQWGEVLEVTEDTRMVHIGPYEVKRHSSEGGTQRDEWALFGGPRSVYIYASQILAALGK